MNSSLYLGKLLNLNNAATAQNTCEMSFLGVAFKTRFGAMQGSHSISTFNETKLFPALTILAYYSEVLVPNDFTPERILIFKIQRFGIVEKLQMTVP